MHPVYAPCEELTETQTDIRNVARERQTKEDRDSLYAKCGHSNVTCLLNMVESTQTEEYTQMII